MEDGRHETIVTPHAAGVLVPNLTRVAVLREPSTATGIGQFAAIQTMASSSGVELSVIDPTDMSGIERAVAAFGHQPNGGVIVTASASTVAHRELIISLLMRYRLPNVYPFRYYSANGGLAPYGPDPIEKLHTRCWLRRSYSQGRDAG